VERSWQEIAGMADPVVRNLCITQRYHDFAVQLRDAGLNQDATWCAFAVWASKTAGASIRGELLPERASQVIKENDTTGEVMHKFNHGLTGWVKVHFTHDHIGRAIETITADVSKAIAEGNVLVFKELAPLFTALIDAHRSAQPLSRQKVGDALAPTLAAAEESGDDMDPVVQAFGAYADALCGAPGSAALVLKANTLAVSHEQRRLQPAIETALNAAITDTIKKVIDEDVIRHVPGEARHLLDALTEDVCNVLDTAWSIALTEVIMRLVTSNETFDLRADVPAMTVGLFPPALADLDGTDAAAVVAQWDRTDGTGAPSGAHDWSVLEERMNFIVNLFRSRQRDAALFNPPFSPEQLHDLDGGRLPPGPL
jgi:hypothetical protein